MLQFIHPNTGNVSKDLFSALAHKADVVLAATIAIALLHMALEGVETSWMLLLTGSLLSILVLTGLNRGARNALGGLLSYIPYSFGIYLFFVEGFARFMALFSGFSVLEAALVIAFFVAGNIVATAGFNAIFYARRLRQSH